MSGLNGERALPVAFDLGPVCLGTALVLIFFFPLQCPFSILFFLGCIGREGKKRIASRPTLLCLADGYSHCFSSLSFFSRYSASQSSDNWTAVSSDTVTYFPCCFDTTRGLAMVFLRKTKT